MSLPWRTGTEDVAAEGKPRGLGSTGKKEGLISIDWRWRERWDRRVQIKICNQHQEAPLIKYGRVICTSGRKLSLEGCPYRSKEMSVHGYVDTWPRPGPVAVSSNYSEFHSHRRALGWT